MRIPGSFRKRLIAFPGENWRGLVILLASSDNEYLRFSGILEEGMELGVRGAFKFDFPDAASVFFIRVKNNENKFK